MNQKIAETLVDELGRHPGIITPDKDLFLDVFVSTTVPESTSFIEVSHKKEQILSSGNFTYHLSFRKLLRNEDAKDFHLIDSPKVYETFFSALGVYSSDHLIKHLMSQRNLVEMMAECNEPFSVLGKFKTCDFDNASNKVYVISRPILIIPGAQRINEISAWEYENASYKKEAGPFRIQKTITREEYFNH